MIRKIDIILFGVALITILIMLIILFIAGGAFDTSHLINVPGNTTGGWDYPYSSMTFICSQTDVTKINMSYSGSITAITFNSTIAYSNGNAFTNSSDPTAHKVLVMTWFCPRGDACIHYLSFSDCAVMNTTKPEDLPASYVLYFWRTGCEYCAQEEPIIHDLLVERYQIISIDIANETMKQYATQYEITGTPTFVASNSERLVGYQTYDQLKVWFGKIRLNHSD